MKASEVERLAALETGLGYIKDKIDHIDKRFEDLVDALQNNYAQKKELDYLKDKIELLEKVVQSNREYNIKVTATVGVIVTLATFAASILF